MFDAGRRPSGRLFYWGMAVAMIAGFGRTAWGAAPAPQSGPATTTIADTVFLADGSRAQGSLIIPVAGVSDRERSCGGWGHDDYDAGSEGGVERSAGAKCGGDSGGSVLHAVSLSKLGPGEVRTEYWMVSSNFSLEPGGGAHDTGVGRGESTSFDPVR